MSAINNNWLEDVTVVNENKNWRTAGDISIFRSAGDVCSYLEAWWVTDNEGFALNGVGHQIIFGVQDNSVVIERSEQVVDGLQVLHAWLLASAQSVHNARTVRAQKTKRALGRLEAQGVLPQSVEGLVAYVGFTN